MGTARNVVLTGLAASFAFGHLALGANEIRVEVFRRHQPPLCECDPLDPLNPCPEVFLFNAGASISIGVAFCTSQINIFAPDAVSDIGPVTITGAGTPDLLVQIASGGFDHADNNPTAAGGNFAGLTFTDPQVRAGARFRGGI